MRDPVDDPMQIGPERIDLAAGVDVRARRLPVGMPRRTSFPASRDGSLKDVGNAGPVVTGRAAGATLPVDAAMTMATWPTTERRTNVDKCHTLLTLGNQHLTRVRNAVPSRSVAIAGKNPPGQTYWECPNAV